MNKRKRRQRTKRDQIEKEVVQQMKAKSDENRMKGKADERERATEKHHIF